MKVVVLTACLWAVVVAMPKTVQQFEIEIPTHVAASKQTWPLVHDLYHWCELYTKISYPIIPVKLRILLLTVVRKSYDSEEEEKVRMKIFIDKVKHIELHNWEYVNKKQSYYKGINQFSDMTFEEYKLYNRLQARKNVEKTFKCSKFQPPLMWYAPAEVDWRTQGYVTPTGSMEGQHFRLSGELVSLSEQQLVDCSKKFQNSGCNGGLMDQAFAYINSILAYTLAFLFCVVHGQDGACKFNASRIVPETAVTGCQDIASGSESDLMKAVASQGPVSVAIDASNDSFQDYSEVRIYNEPGCSSVNLDHGVLVVGYGSDEGEDYWIVKNSWGKVWGTNGYILMSRNMNNQCGIATAASFPQLAKN
ncbi:hypothetical protein C0Q70_10877 [Pomacea canaliculata]|uniref:Peptidase C1A papain C-terminal domain-containing protein n=1 Tax=Pomacea canaliculata TaxID=400727 RepID=A0A2T7P4E9_POMCA|nr:hypothetical protein C0Q70_10877 [Pomacea canaliculata]